MGTRFESTMGAVCGCEADEPSAQVQAQPYTEGHLHIKVAHWMGCTWEKSFFTLRNGRLEFVDEPGVLIEQEHVLWIDKDIEMYEEPQSGAPTPHRFAIEDLQRRKWTLCALSAREKAMWMADIAKARRPDWRPEIHALKCGRCAITFSFLTSK